MTPPLPGEGQVLSLTRQIPGAADPVELLRREGCHMLETAETSDGRGGRSIVVTRCALRITACGHTVVARALTAGGEPLLQILRDVEGADISRADDGALVLRFPPPGAGSEEARLGAPSVMDVPRKLLRSLQDLQPMRVSTPLLLGTFSYDLLGTFEKLPPARAEGLGWADLDLWLPDRMIWIDHRRGTTTVVCHVFGGSRAREQYTDAVEAVGSLSTTIQRLVHARSADPLGSTRPTLPREVSVDMSDEEYGSLVSRCIEHIVAGDVFQIVPSRTFSAPCSDPLAVYTALRALEPSPYMFYLAVDDNVLLGASPEIAVRVDGDRRVHVKPIAGTRPRGRTGDGSIDPDLDSRLEVELRTDAKETAEHMMLVDLARNDVARVSEPGTRRVDRLLEVERYSHVMHLVSHVSGVLRPDLDALSAYVATMNMGTLVGAPKIRAAELLRREEPSSRGPYGGAVGYVTLDGRMDTGIVIRSAVVHDGRAHVRAGAGIVFDSDPVAEATETRRKAEAVLRAIGGSTEGRTAPC